MNLGKAIHAAILNGEVEWLGHLLRSEPSSRDVRNGFGWTPLHTASYALCERSARLLLRAGADVTARDQLGNSPLQLVQQIDPRSPLVALLTGDAPQARPTVRKPWWRRLLEVLVGSI